MDRYWGLLVCLLTCCTIATEGQDMQVLSNHLNNALLQQQFVKDYPEQAKDALGDLLELNSLWTDLADGELSKADLTSDMCLQALENFTFMYKDNSNLSLIVDLIDATGKLGAGVLQGNFFLNGAYDECLAINAPTAYCVAPVTVLGLPGNVPIMVDVCMPSACTSEDLASLFQRYLGNYSTNADVIQCQTSTSKPYHWTAIVMILICILLAVVIILSTVADVLIRCWQQHKIQNFIGLHQHKSSNQGTLNSDDNETESEDKPLLSKSAKTNKHQNFDPVEWVQAFSLYKTVPTILSTKQTSAAIGCLNGIRVISMFWVILGHVHLVAFYSGVDNQFELEQILNRFSFQAVENAYFSVDSFFLLSAVLLAYLTFRQMKRRNGKFPFAMFYIHRYLRLTPVYAFVLFFIWWLGMHLADGPRYSVYDVGGDFWNSCESSWWANFLYINNLYPWELTKSCLDWSWYLANDMQFFVISPLMLIPMYFFLPLGLIVIGGFLLVSFIVTATLAGVYDLQPSNFASLAYHYIPPNNYSTSLSTDILYIKPWHRIQPYLVGLVLGYLLYKQVKVPFNRYFKLGSYLIMWCLAFIFCMSTVYGLYGIWHGHIPSKAENIIYFTFSRFTWALGLALLVFICHNGYGGVVNTFLSMSFWTPLSRLTFTAYLVHPTVVTVVFISERKNMYYNDIQMAAYAVASTAIAYAVAFVIAVCVEFPFGNLEMAFFKLFGVGARESTRADTEVKREPAISNK